MKLSTLLIGLAVDIFATFIFGFIAAVVCITIVLNLYNFGHIHLSKENLTIAITFPVVFAFITLFRIAAVQVVVRKNAEKYPYSWSKYTELFLHGWWIYPVYFVTAYAFVYAMPKSNDMQFIGLVMVLWATRAMILSNIEIIKKKKKE